MNILANATIYCVDGTEIPISQAFTLERVIPRCFANSVCVNPICSLSDFILSAIIKPPFLE